MKPARTLQPLLLVAILAMPALFCWLLLRAGYRRSLRRAAFVYAAGMTSVGVLGQMSR